MKLITWNIQWGLGIDGRLDLGRIVSEAQRIADFDVLSLQDVADGFTDLDQLAGRTSLPNSPRCFRIIRPVEGIAVDLPGEKALRRRFGNMILSRLPVRRVIATPCHGSRPGHAQYAQAPAGRRGSGPYWPYKGHDDSP